MLPQIGGALEDIHLTDLLIEFQEKTSQYMSMPQQKVEKDKVVFEKDGKEEAVSADVIILSVGQKSAGTELVKELRAAGYKTIVAGDAKTCQVCQCHFGRLLCGSGCLKEIHR